MPVNRPAESAFAGNIAANVPRLGLVRDFLEEGWPSMDLCAEMLAENLHRDFRERLTVVDMCPPFRRRLQRVPWLNRKRFAFNGDRLLNRFWDYPRFARRHRDTADAFYIVDHSYSQVIEGLPAARTGVHCYDLDTFRCVLTPQLEPRPRWFRTMALRIMNGFQKAAVVFYSHDTVRAQIEQHQLIDPVNLVYAPIGFAPEFRPDSQIDAAADDILRPIGARPFLLHVGSCIPRKRIDVLLEVFARLHSKRPDLRLVKVGGEWTAEHRQILSNRRLEDSVVHVSGIARTTLASLYRRAQLVLMPSESEGFGLPVLEAHACGARVLASDLVVLRDVAGTTARFAPVGDVASFVATAEAWLHVGDSPEAIALRVAQAERYSWQRHAQIIGDTYLRLLS